MKAHKFFTCRASLIFMLGLSRTVYCQGNLLANGSFENGYNDWTVQNYITSPGCQIGPIFYTGFPTNYPHGSSCAVITYDGGAISQTVATIPGAYYTLTFSAIQFDGTNASSVSVNGSLAAAIQFQNYSYILPVQSPYSPNFNSGWENFAFGFLATSNTTTILFSEIPDIYVSADHTIYYSKGGLDNVSVTAAPEPSAWALLTLGLAGLVIRQRRN